MLETGIKVVDLLCPYAKGGKIGLFGGVGVGKTVYPMNLSTTLQNNMVGFQYLQVLENVLEKEMIYCENL